MALSGGHERAQIFNKTSEELVGIDLLGDPGIRCWFGAVAGVEEGLAGGEAGCGFDLDAGAAELQDFGVEQIGDGDRIVDEETAIAPCLPVAQRSAREKFSEGGDKLRQRARGLWGGAALDNGRRADDLAGDVEGEDDSVGAGRENGAGGGGIEGDIELGVGRDIAGGGEGSAHDDDLAGELQDAGALGFGGGEIGQRADGDDGDAAGGGAEGVDQQVVGGGGCVGGAGDRGQSLRQIAHAIRPVNVRRIVARAVGNGYAEADRHVWQAAEGENLAGGAEGEFGADIASGSGDGDEIGEALFDQTLQPEQRKNVVAAGVGIEENWTRRGAVHGVLLPLIHRRGVGRIVG